MFNVKDNISLFFYNI